MDSVTTKLSVLARMKSYSPVFVWVAALLFAPASLAEEANFTSIKDLRALSANSLAKAAFVRVHGVVTWSDGDGEFTVQDESAGIFVNLVEARRRGIWQNPGASPGQISEGREVLVVGVTDPGGYAPVILPSSVLLGRELPLPLARTMEHARFFSGADAAQRIEVRGVPIGLERVSKGWTIRMAAGPDLFTIEVSDSALRNPSAIVDAEVRIEGVVGSGFNTRSELTNVRVLVGRSDDIHIEKAAPPPFAAPRVALDELLPFKAEPALPHRLLVRGVVTFAVPGRFYYIQEGNSAVRVESRSARSVSVGDRVEASGFVDMTRHVGQLLEATIRKIGTGSLPEPITVTPEAVIALNAAALDIGQAARPYDFDGHLIRFKGRLLSVQAAPDGDRMQRSLILETPTSTLSAILHTADAAYVDSLVPGSTLDVTGIVRLEFSRMAGTHPFFRPTRLDVLMRSQADVVVVQAPSWWTAQRLLGVVASGALALGSALLWVSQLRRRIHRKTLELAAEMRARKDAAIEFQAALRERNRLAANLHDTLLQTMGGLNFQIQACEAEMTAPSPRGTSGVHLEVARKMLDHAIGELRDSVWALRSLPLHGLALPDALRSLAERAGAGHRARIEVQTSGDVSDVPNFIAGNLLLAAQEAVHNALKHGDPESVIVVVNAEAKLGRIVLTVADDGSGFTLGEQAGAAQGHFGIAGTRERIDRLAGSFSIESAPGLGTTVRIEVPLRPYDQGMV